MTKKEENSEKSAFACIGSGYHQRGLTKREEFARSAMVGFLAAGNYDFIDIAKLAVRAADELLEQLEKEKE